jgi:CheY-like chemotaxis protein
MTSTPSVLIVDDQIIDIGWLIDLIQRRGYVIVLATNEEAARQQLESVQQGQASFALAIIDVMVAVKDLMHWDSLDDKIFVDSRSTGIRLCHYARRQLGLSEKKLPIISITGRDDQEVRREMKKINIRLFNRGPERDIRSFVEKHLPMIAS